MSFGLDQKYELSSISFDFFKRFSITLKIMSIYYIGKEFKNFEEKECIAVFDSSVLSPFPRPAEKLEFIKVRCTKLIFFRVIIRYI